jgi:hypothetical protein
MNALITNEEHTLIPLYWSLAFRFNSRMQLSIIFPLSPDIVNVPSLFFATVIIGINRVVKQQNSFTPPETVLPDVGIAIFDGKHDAFNMQKAANVTSTVFFILLCPFIIKNKKFIKKYPKTKTIS